MTKTVETAVAVTMATLVDLYNIAAIELGEATVNRFSDRKTAERRTQAMIERATAQSDSKTADLPAFPATVIAPALARGAEGKDSVHSRRSLEQGKGRTKPKLIENAAPDAGAGIINRAGRVVLKGNKEVRSALKAAAKLAGGTRLAPRGFADFSAFLNGFKVEVDRQTTIACEVVGTDKIVKLVIGKDGSWVVN